MAIPPGSDITTHLLHQPSLAHLRKFGSLGYLVLLRLQSDITAIEAHKSDALRARIRLHTNGASDGELAAPDLTEEGLLRDLQLKLYNYCKYPHFVRV